MAIIKLTMRNGEDVYINPDVIGHFYWVESTKRQYNKKDPRHIDNYSVVGTLCHNNGGFRVRETTKQIITKLTKQNNNTIK